MKRAAELLTQLDVLAPEIRLKVGGRSAVKSLPGSFLSVAAIGLVFYLAVVQFSEFFDSTSPTVTEETSITGKYVPINLQAEKKIPILFITFEDGSIVPWEDLPSYLTIKFRRNIWYNSENNNTVYEVDNLNVVSCAELIRKGRFDKDFYVNIGAYRTAMENGICVDTENRNSTIEGSYTDSPSTISLLDIFPCSLPDASKCKSAEELSRLWIMIVNLEPNINLSDKKSPLTYSSNSDSYFKLNTAMMNYYTRKLMKVEIFNDNGFLFGKQSAASFFKEEKLQSFTAYRDPHQLSCSGKNLDNLGVECLQYLQIITMSSNSQRKTTRAYKGLLETLGELGGLNEIVWACFHYLYIYFHSLFAKKFLVKAVYNIESTGRSASCCKKPRRENSKVKPDLFRKETDRSNREIFQNDNGKISEEAYSRIEGFLDVVEMSRDLESLKFIASVLWTSSQRLDLPSISLKANSRRASSYDFFNGTPPPEKLAPPKVIANSPTPKAQKLSSTKKLVNKLKPNVKKNSENQESVSALQLQDDLQPIEPPQGLECLAQFRQRYNDYLRQVQDVELQIMSPVSTKLFGMEKSAREEMIGEVGDNPRERSKFSAFL